MLYQLFYVVFDIMIVKYYNQIKNLYKINYINVNILHKRPVTIPFIKPKIK